MQKNTVKLINKIIITLIYLVMLFCLSTTYVNAQGSVNPEDYKPTELTQQEAQSAIDKISPIIGYISGIGMAISVITLIVIGIKYMFGSVESKAEYKKTMMPYLIGAFLVFGVTTVLTIIMEFTNDLF